MDPARIACLWDYLAILTLAAVSAELRFASKQAFEGEAVDVVVRITNRLPIPFYGMTIEGAWSRESTGPRNQASWHSRRRFDSGFAD